MMDRKPYTKPTVAEACVRCGSCCRRRLCELGFDHGATRAPCAFLEREPVKVHGVQRHRCGLVAGKYGDVARWLLGVGEGCGYVEIRIDAGRRKARRNPARDRVIAAMFRAWERAEAWSDAS